MVNDEQLVEFVDIFKKWINQNYSNRSSNAGADLIYFPDDFWGVIYTYVGAIFDRGLQNCSTKDLENILYLIARNYRISKLLNWQLNSTLSKVGNLSETDFLLLAQTTQNLNCEEYDDAYRQIITILKTYHSNRFLEFIPKFMDKAYYSTKCNFVKIKALSHFVSIYHPNYPTMIKEAWTTGNEWVKYSILSEVSPLVSKSEIVEHLIELAKNTHLNSYEKFKKKEIENLKLHLSRLITKQSETLKTLEEEGYQIETFEEFEKRYHGFGKELFQKINDELPKVYQYIKLAYKPSDALCYASAFYDDGLRRIEIRLDQEAEEIVFIPKYTDWHAQFGDRSESAINSIVALLRCELHILESNNSEII
jgi:hypothetical protein